MLKFPVRLYVTLQAACLTRETHAACVKRVKVLDAGNTVSYAVRHF